MTGMVVGVLNSYDRFGAFAIAPFFWNVAIIAVLVAPRPGVPGGGRDLRLRDRGPGRHGRPAPDPRLGPPQHAVRHPPRAARAVPASARADWRDSTVRRVLILMLPVTISLGLINVNLLINSIVGFLVSDQAPAAIDKAFRIYMLPQGIFSVAIATVLFPTLARFAARADHDGLRSTMANGMRQILLLLVPAMAAILVLSEPMTRLVYERGEFDATSTDLVVRGALLVRVLAAVQRPVPAADPDLLQPPAALAADRDLGWQPRDHGRASALLLYEPYGVGGIVAATGIATIASVVAQAWVLRGAARPARARPAASGAASRIVLAGGGAGRRVATASGTSSTTSSGAALGGQIVSLGVALGAGALVYLAAVLALRVPEAAQALSVIRRALGAPQARLQAKRCVTPVTHP